ncbi:MAG TPA: ATP-dependent DNA helicase RecG [Gemmataceae bacterium]|nr:ATP-dependent DNA helicase RecG [Gemmataceae bacterium]
MSSETPDDALAADLQTLPGATPTRLELLGRLGLRTVGDLLFHFPRSYEDLTDLRPIAALAADVPQTAQGEVVEIEGRSLASGGTLVSVVLCDDGVHCLEGVWFNQPYAASRFRFGQRLSFSGKPKWRAGHWQMNNPRVQALDGGAAASPGVVPVYPLTEGLRPDHLRPLIRKALDRCGAKVVENLPESLRGLHDWPSAAEALRTVHFPRSVEEALRARRRFIYEEFLLLQLGLALRRREVRDRGRAPVLPTSPTLDLRIRRLFPFALTGDQDRAVAQICRDLASERPMQRLLQADVGAGKTAVAVYALLVAVADKHQAALMAPTEVLARQHFRTLERYLAHSRVRRLLLTGGLTPRERREALEKLRTGEIDLVVGTQALVQEDVQFARLGLVVVDEQHRFGVHQRARFRKLAADPHYLVMTATPIPRTAALAVFGDLDVSVMRQLPPGRKPVVTRWVEADQRERVYQRLRDGLTAGKQGYIVCPLVEESAVLDVKAATETYAELQAGPFREFRLGLLHGRMDEKEKDEVMRRFRAGEIQLLVCTTVIEVGVDVPNATLLVVEHAERFGLSQLHQLRGRVSRGPTAGECYVFAAPGNDESRERLKAFARLRDGFALAEMDMRLRGVGQFFGARQHGLGDLRFGDLIADADLLSDARRDALALVKADAQLRRPQHARLRAEVWRRYGKTLELAEVG